MIPLAFGFAWLGYSYGLYGWCLIKGYDVKLRQLMNPVNVYQWPAGGPPIMTPDTIFPNGQNASTTGPGDNKPGPGFPAPKPPGNAPCPPGWIKVFGKCIPISPI